MDKLMRAELKTISSNDTTDWDSWQPADPSNVMHWFTLGIGPEGEASADYFQTAVATRYAVDQRADKQHPFKGVILDPFDKEKIKPVLRERIEAIRGGTWDEIVKQLRETMTWEYA